MHVYRMSNDSPPPNFARELTSVGLETRMKEAYLNYAMSVIIGRALPDVRDGLKPVQRRTLYAMHEVGNDWNKAFKKSARIVGDVLGKYHPHSPEAVYDSLVRMAQDFTMREMLVDGQGNFGSIDGDNQAAMRYTEVRMAKITHSLLDDLDKETVEFVPNYDGGEREPTVLPARFPNLLVNGAAGIAVGMATNIPPHNLGETVDACLHLLENPAADIDALIRLLPAPDFPTGAFIYGVDGVRDAYRTGRGRVVMRGRAHVEDLPKGNKQAIVIDELPYKVNKALLVERIARLAVDKKINGISDIRDESDRDGIRVVIELWRGENAEVVLNNLYKETSLQENFSVNMVALTDGAPKQMNLHELLSAFLAHRREVVERRALFELRKARLRAHLLEGYATAVANVDAIVELIKSSASPAEAERGLLATAWPAQIVADMLNRLEDSSLVRAEDAPSGGLDFSSKAPAYRLSPLQAKAILDMRLARLTAMERDKINGDYAEVVGRIVELLALLGDETKIQKVVGEELHEIKKQFANPRRSEIVFSTSDIEDEQLITREPMIVTLSHRGYVKRQAVSDYRTQKRGGRGKQAATTRENDFINSLFVASTHDYLLVFTNRGRVYWKKVYELPLASRISRGRPIAGLLELAGDEEVQTVLPIPDFSGERYVLMATAKGVVKKTPIIAFSRPRRGGIIAVNLKEDDSLINAVITGGEHAVLLLSAAGKAIRFSETVLRPMGRGAGGVRGMRLPEGGNIVSMLAFSPEEQKQCAVLVATANGRGKRTTIGDFPIRGRGGSGVIALRVNDKTGAVVGASVAGDNDELMLITDGGVLVRTTMRDIRRMGRATQGVRLINMDKGFHLVSIARIEDDTEEDEEK